MEKKDWWTIKPTWCKIELMEIRSYKIYEDLKLSSLTRNEKAEYAVHTKKFKNDTLVTEEF